MTETRTGPPPPWLELAGRALRLAMSGQLDRAVKVVERIAVEHGPDDIAWVVLAWIDTMLAHRARVDGGPEPGQNIRLSFVRADTGDRSDATGVPPEVAVAGRLIAARAADDKDMYQALVESLGKQWGPAVIATLAICATNINSARGGYVPGGV